MNKLTDSEIVKAFECCKSFDDLRVCYKCPALETDGCASGKTYISDFIIKEILALLKRKDAEIERLQNENKWFADIGKLYSEVRADAIKEFAERLKCRSHRFKTIDRIFVDCIPLDYIDKLVKEMTEQTTFEKVEHNSLCETETYKGGV